MTRRIQPIRADPSVSIQDGSGVTVADLFETHTYEFDTGPEVEVNVDQATGQVIRDSQFMILDGDFFQFDTGYALVMPEDLPGVPAGATMADGLVIGITNNQGLYFALEFDNDGDTLSGAFPVTFDDGTTQSVLQQRTAAAINVMPFNVVASAIGTNLVSMANDRQVDYVGRIVVDTQTSPITTLLQTPAVTVSEETILIPDGGYVNGQTLSIADGGTLDGMGNILPVVFEFEDTDIGDGVAGGNVQIDFDATTTAQDIADQLMAAFADPANNLRLLPTMDSSTFAPLVAIHFDTGVKLSGEYGDVPIVRVARGAEFTDGDQFDIVTEDGTVTFEYEIFGGTNPGTVPIDIDVFLGPAAVATLTAEAITNFTIAEATAVNEYVVINGQQRPLGKTGPAPVDPHLIINETIRGLTIEELWDWDPNSDPPTYNQIDGYLQGFEETMSRAQFQAQLENEANILRIVDDATNPGNGQIEIQGTEDHGAGLKTGDSVIIRGVNGNVYANGLFDVTVNGADTFLLQGTQNRDNRGQGRFDYTNGGTFYNYEVSSSSSRTNFLAAKVGMFDSVDIFTDQGTLGGVTPPATRVPLLAADTADDVADTLAFFINREFFPNASATSIGNRVTIINASS